MRILSVLIETLWNVNFLSPVIVLDRVIVLIETLWNVNFSADTQQVLRSTVLIETLWNVNFEMLQYLLRLPVY